MDGYQRRPDTPLPDDHQTPMYYSKEAAERQARIDYIRSLKPPRKTMPFWMRALVAAAAFVVLGGGAAVGYWKLRRDDAPSKPAATSKPASGQVEARNEPLKDVPTKRHESSELNLSFEYPENWAVAENGGGRLTATSAPTTITDANNKPVVGQIVITISPKGKNLTPFEAGNAVAVRDSEKIKYTKPTDVQRGETYLSFVQYANTKTLGVLDAVYITGDYGYQKGQVIRMSEMSNLDPLVGVTFNKCKDSTCNSVQPTNIRADMWNQRTFAESIKKSTDIAERQLASGLLSSTCHTYQQATLS